MSDQLTLEFKPTATDAVRDVAAKRGPLRSLEILIALWDSYTWEEVEMAILLLTRRGEIEIYRIKGGCMTEKYIACRNHVNCGGWCENRRGD